MHKQGGLVQFSYHCCVVGDFSNTKQGLLHGRRDLVCIHLVEPVQDPLGKQSGKHTFVFMVNFKCKIMIPAVKTC